MKIATWNVNSIRAREERLLRWLSANEPDVLCLQELKVTEQQFPSEKLKEIGYGAAVYGQKTYNGVAILSKWPIEQLHYGLGDAVDDPQARFLSGCVQGVRILSVYVPNGERVGADKYQYKLAWLERLRGHLQSRHTPDEPLLLGGDLNIAPDEMDVASPEDWLGTVLFNPEMSEAMRALLDWGLKDVFRIHQSGSGLYSWWDYRQLSFQKNQGLRIDHILATQPLAARSIAASIDRAERKGVKPSDHAPVLAEFEWP